MRMLSFIAACIIVFSLGSCTSRSVEPTRTSRHTIDTLFQQKIIVLQPEMDSICRSTTIAVYKEAIDSIMTTRNVDMNILVE